MEIKKVVINNVECNLYENVLIKNKKVRVASPQLDSEIAKLIEEGHYSDTMCTIDGENVSVQVVDEYYFVYGDEENLNPTEQEIIESIEDVLDDNDIQYLNTL